MTHDNLTAPVCLVGSFQMLASDNPLSEPADVNPKLSVLMSVYAGESAQFLASSLESLAIQTVPANEVVIVKDGPTSQELDSVIASFRNRLPLKVVSLEMNVGLGRALQCGLAHCQGELVARMDTDDICCPDRFEKQLRFLESNPDIDVVGGTIAEFNGDPQNAHAIRRLPSLPQQIERFAHTRNPLNHMTVVFRKASVLAAGNYQHCGNRGQMGLEDYHLWARMLMNGASFQNLPDILVYARCGNGMLRRRGGFNYLTEEIKLHSYFMQIGFLTKTQFLFNIVTRVPVRIAPLQVRSVVYRRILRKETSTITA